MVNIEKIVAAVETVRSTKGFVSIEAYKPPEFTPRNEYLLFIKPEIIHLVPTSVAAVKIVFDRLEAFGQSVTAASVLHASYLERHHIMDQHYGVINAISRLGKKALSETALRRVGELCLEKGVNQSAVFGAHEFLDRYPYFSAKSLAILSDNISSSKIAPGTYVVPITLEGSTAFVLNAFHPEQLERYTTNDSVIAAFVLTTSSSWKEIRGTLTGATNPTKASSESIRGNLLRLRESIGLTEVNTGANGVHVSAGPIEAMIEIVRFMSNLDHGSELHISATCMGRALIKSGLSSETLNYLATNPAILLNGKNASLFDLTEELDSDVACTELADMLSVGQPN
jgi:nucleoside diphosphate kinase